MGRVLDNYSPESWRKVHVYMEQGKERHLILSDAEVREELEGFGDETLQAVVNRLDLDYVDSEPTASNAITNGVASESTVAVDTSNFTALAAELRHNVDGKLSALDGRIERAAVENRAATQSAQTSEQRVAELAQRVGDTLDTYQKILQSRLDSISNTVAGYIAGGQGQNGKVEPLQVVITLPSGVQTILEGEHTCWAFEKKLRLLNAGLHLNVVGPRGSGKSTVAKQLAQALGKRFYRTDVSGGRSESVFTVKLSPLGASGSFRPVASPFLMGYGGLENTLDAEGLITIRYAPERAGLCAIEEADAGEPSTMVVLNGGLGSVGGGDMLVIPELAIIGLDPQVHQSKQNLIMMLNNTFGTGMDLQYAGRQMQDAAFLDRFYAVYLDYDDVLEAKIGNLPLPMNRPAWQAAPTPSLEEWQDLARWVLSVRDAIRKSNMKLDWGTRNMLKAKAARYAGVPTQEVKEDLLLGLPKDLRMRVLNTSGVSL